MNSGTRIALPDKQLLEECFEYDADTGVLTWRVRPLSHFKNAHGMNTFNAKYAGQVAGHHAKTGYMTVAINSRPYLAHRIIWKLITGIDPDGEIDHRNHDKRGNQWANLREATHQQNTFNRPARSSTGVKGVSWDRKRQKFAAHIRLEGRTKFLGRFPTIEDAGAAYREVALRHQGEFAPI